MGAGPRDWSPPRYADLPPGPPPCTTPATHAPARPVKKENDLYGLVSVLLGLIACWLPLSQPGVGSGYSGFAVTTAGITAVVLAGRSTSRILPAIGGTLGVLGTVLCVWSLVAFYAPGTLPPVPSLAALTHSTQEVEPHVAGGAAISSAMGARVCVINSL
jgi:hypothetical protein